MKIVMIPKPGKKGKYRKIYIPDPEEKRELRSVVPRLNLKAEELDTHGVQHGFTEGRSAVTNARAHIGWEFTVSFDLQDFFDSVTVEHVRKVAPNPESDHIGGIKLSKFFPGGRARQGLPTSPALANMAAAPMDNDIMKLCPKSRFIDPPFCYTRYADDLTFSCHTQATVDYLLHEIPKIVEAHKFKINPSKTKVQCAKAGRRIITGVAVGDTDITIPRETRRRIRAGNHQAKVGLKRRNIRRMLFNRRRWQKQLPLRLRFWWQLKGLQEWAKLKGPKEPKQHQSVIMKAAARVVTAIAGESISHRIFGNFTRKFG